MHGATSSASMSAAPSLAASWIAISVRPVPGGPPTPMISPRRGGTTPTSGSGVWFPRRAWQDDELLDEGLRTLVGFERVIDSDGDQVRARRWFLTVEDAEHHPPAVVDVGNEGAGQSGPAKARDQNVI